MRLAVLAGESPDMVRVSMAQRHHIDRLGINACGPQIAEQMASTRAVWLPKSHARIDQDELVTGVDDERILVNHEIVLVEEIGGDKFVDPLLGQALEQVRTECAEPKRTIRNHGAFETADLKAIGGGDLLVRHRVGCVHGRFFPSGRSCVGTANGRT